MVSHNNNGIIINRSRYILLYTHTDIIGSPCTVPAAPSVATHNDNTSVAVDVYLADYTERIRGLYLQPGWIASVSISHNNTVTYGDVKSLIYNNMELEVSLYSIYLQMLLFPYILFIGDEISHAL